MNHPNRGSTPLFQRAIVKATIVRISRDCRLVYIYVPCVDAECQALLEQYEESEGPDVADRLIEALDAAGME